MMIWASFVEQHRDGEKANMHVKKPASLEKLPAARDNSRSPGV